MDACESRDRAVATELCTVNRIVETEQEVVRPTMIVRRIVGSSRLADFVKRRDGSGLAFAAAHAALIVATGWVLWRVPGTA